MHRLRIIEGLFSMVIPSNMIALHTIHFAGEEHEIIWSTVFCISKQHGSRDARDQTQTTDHLIERLSCYTRSLRLYDLSGQLKSQEYPTEPLLRLSAPRAEILLAGNLNRELKSWLGIYPKRFSYCDFCLNVVPGWKQQLSLPL